MSASIIALLLTAAIAPRGAIAPGHVPYAGMETRDI